MVLFAGKTMRSVSERFVGMRTYLKAPYKTPFLSFTFVYRIPSTEPINRTSLERPLCRARGQSVKSSVTWQFMRTDHDDVTTMDVSRRRTNGKHAEMTRVTPTPETTAAFLSRVARTPSAILISPYAVCHSLALYPSRRTDRDVFVRRLPLACPIGYIVFIHSLILLATYGHKGLLQSAYSVMSCMRVCRKQALSRVKYYYYVINSKIQQATIMTVIMTK